MGKSLSGGTIIVDEVIPKTVALRNILYVNIAHSKIGIMDPISGSVREIRVTDKSSSYADSIFRKYLK